MPKPLCLFTILGFLLSGAQSWELAMTKNDHISFYNGTTNIHKEKSHFSDLTALAYDAVNNILLFVDRQNDNASIFGLHIATSKYQSLVRKKSESIHSIAFDPITSLLFWTDTMTKRIYSMSLKTGAENSPYGNLWMQMDDEIPAGIAVDSCRGYVYWTNINTAKATIERARFDKSDREVIVDKNIFRPVSLVIDQRTKSLYWIEDFGEGIRYNVKRSDLNGLNESVLFEGTYHQPTVLTVSKDSLYWVDTGYHTVKKLPKDPLGNAKPSEIDQGNADPLGIVANYLIEDQTEGVPECEALRNLPRSDGNFTYSEPPEMGLFCVHGEQIDKVACKCYLGYTGDRCEISVCQNFCFQGDCKFDDEGQPSCSCKHGFKGKRCEKDLCSGLCLNNGVCSINEEHKPTCSCATDYEGLRCEREKVFTTTTERDRTTTGSVPKSSVTVPTSTVNVPTAAPPSSKMAPVECNCTSNATSRSMFSEHSSDEFVVSCNEGWDAVRDPVIMVLGIVCGLLVLLSVVLFTKIHQLRKRPRIKKRIIVNKNVTPMTARPDQCEITIENCCNMNICETPCFEPRSTIRPTLLDSKPGKEEKKNLIANMEYPDDY